MNDPSELRLSGGSGPASAVAVLAKSGFMSGGGEPARHAVLEARMSTDIDVEGDVIDAAAREVGARLRKDEERLDRLCSRVSASSKLD